MYVYICSRIKSILRTFLMSEKKIIPIIFILIFHSNGKQYTYYQNNHIFFSDGQMSGRIKFTNKFFFNALKNVK